MPTKAKTILHNSPKGEPKWHKASDFAEHKKEK